MARPWAELGQIGYIGAIGASVERPWGIRGRYVFPVEQPPIEHGVVIVQGERIFAVGKDSYGEPVIDAGDVAILPGLCNAHTHLEFSELEAPLGTPGMLLPEWIRLVIQSRRERATDAKGVQRGLEQSLRFGVTTLGEIASTPPAGALEPALDVTVFLELLGLRPERVAPLVAQAERFVAESSPAKRFASQLGLSPHAPYSVHPDVMAAAATISRRMQLRLPVAMHVAESREELELLQTARGPFRDLLMELGVWTPEVFSQPRRPLDYLHAMAQAARALVIHGNYLVGDEIEFLAQQAKRMSVVYCPRTHAYFGHERYPQEQMLRAGVRVALGTDSRASNPDLDLLAEMRFVAERFPAISPEMVLRLGTLAGAEALGREKAVGSLARGKQANLILLPVSDHQAADPHEVLFQEAKQAPTAVMVAGAWLVEPSLVRPPGG